MLDLVVVDGKARGIVVRDLISAAISSHAADAAILAAGRYANVLFLSTNARGSSASAIWRAYKRGVVFANPCYTQIHPTRIPVNGSYQSKLTLMSESLRNDGRVWVPKARGDKRAANAISEAGRDYFLERRYPSHDDLRATSPRVPPRKSAGGASKAPGTAPCDDGWHCRSTNRHTSRAPTPRACSVAPTPSRRQPGWLVTAPIQTREHRSAARRPLSGTMEFNPLSWAIVLIAVLVALAYVLGVMRQVRPSPCAGAQTNAVAA